MAEDEHPDKGAPAAAGHSGAAPVQVIRPRPRTPLRDNLEWIVIVVLFVLVVRQMVVEAFRIRHGSMAPVLLGVHKEVRCPNCGWVIEVGKDKDRVGRDGEVECSNCRYHWGGASRYDERDRPILFKGPEPLEWLWNSAQSSDGERLTKVGAANRVYRGPSRIFVNKFIYQLRKPRRWEVVVFLYPLYSVRCKLCHWQSQVESLEDAICPDCGSTEFEVSSKNFIKRVVGLPGETVSLEDGDVYVNGRISRKPMNVQKELWFHVFDSRFMPRQEVKPTWDLSDRPQRWTRAPEGGALLVDARGPGPPVTAAFGRRFVDFYAYDGLSREVAPYAPGAAGRHEVGDCRIRAKVRVLEHDGPGSEVILAIEDAGHQFAFCVGVGPEGQAVLKDNGAVVAAREVKGLAEGESAWLVLENYDDRVVCRLGDKEVIVYDYGGRPTHNRAVRFGARGAQVLWQRIIIERDIFYINVRGDYPDGSVYKLEDGEYFVLGDNSPASSDSRRWERPGVPEENIIGRAFFVFWPIHHMKWLAGGAVQPKAGE